MGGHITIKTLHKKYRRLNKKFALTYLIQFGKNLEYHLNIKFCLCLNDNVKAHIEALLYGNFSLCWANRSIFHDFCDSTA